MERSKILIMGIVEVRDTLLLWVKSCQTHEQVTLIGEIVQDYIIDRFEGKEQPIIIMTAAESVLEQMSVQNILISQKQLT